jgi:hypothetical protein
MFFVVEIVGIREYDMFECSDMLYPYCKSGRCHMIIYQGTNHQTKVNYL